MPPVTKVDDERYRCNQCHRVYKLPRTYNAHPCVREAFYLAVDSTWKVLPVLKDFPSLPSLVRQTVYLFLDRRSMTALYRSRAMARDFVDPAWNGYWQERLADGGYASLFTGNTYVRYRNDTTPSAFPPLGIAYVRLIDHQCMSCDGSGYTHYLQQQPWHIVCNDCRGVILDQALAAHGLVRRSDSKLCKQFITCELRTDMTLQHVVDMIAEMKWLFECTPYKKELSRAIDAYVEQYDSGGDDDDTDDIDFDVGDFYISRGEAHSIVEPRVRQEVLKRFPKPAVYPWLRRVRKMNRV